MSATWSRLMAVVSMLEAEGVIVCSTCRRNGVIKIRINWRDYPKVRDLRLPPGFEIIF